MEKNALTRDPVCGMQLREDKAIAVYTYQGIDYYFCGMGCMERFKSDPEKYLKRQREGKGIWWEDT